MSRRLTEINLPGVWGAGIGDWGLKSVPEMIAELRRYAAEEKARAEAILAAADSDFRVVTFLGAHKRAALDVLQEGRDAK